MREVHAEYIRETPSFVHVSMDITPADANKSSYSYGPWILRKAEEPEPVSTSTHDKRARKLPNRIWNFGGHSVKNNSNNGNNDTKNIFANVGTSYDDPYKEEGDSDIIGLLTGLSNFDYVEDFGLRGGDIRKLQLVSDITDIIGIHDVKLRDFVHLDFWFYTGRVFDQDRSAFTEHILRAARDEGVSERGCNVRATTTMITSSALCVSPGLLSSTEEAWHDKPSFGTFSSESSVGVDFTQFEEARCLLSYIALKALDPVESERGEEEPGEATGAVWIFYTAPKRISFGWHV
jgi:hypothetical protein